MIKRFLMAAVGVVLVIGGARLFATDPPFVLDLLLGGAMATGVGLVLKALVDGGDKGRQR